jgi:hypothetical protein
VANRGYRAGAWTPPDGWPKKKQDLEGRLVMTTKPLSTPHMDIPSGTIMRIEYSPNGRVIMSAVDECPHCGTRARIALFGTDVTRDAVLLAAESDGQQLASDYVDVEIHSPIASFPELSTRCAVCGGRQYDTPSGPCCVFGHGGAGGKIGNGGDDAT